MAKRRKVGATLVGGSLDGTVHSHHGWPPVVEVGVFDESLRDLSVEKNIATADSVAEIERYTLRVLHTEYTDIHFYAISGMTNYMALSMMIGAYGK